MISPAIFEVAAKKTSPIWHTEQYKDADFRQNLNQTSNKVVFTHDEEVAEKMRVTQYNLKVSNISEYSNAINRGRVFTNPKFSSC